MSGPGTVGSSAAVYTPVVAEPKKAKIEQPQIQGHETHTPVKVAEKKSEGTLKTNIPEANKELGAELEHGAVHPENAEHAEGWLQEALHFVDHKLVHPTHTVASPLEAAEKTTAVVVEKFGEKLGTFAKVFEEAHHLVKGAAHLAPVIEGAGDLAAEELAHVAKATEEGGHIAKVVRLAPTAQEAAGVVKAVAPVAEEAVKVAEVVAHAAPGTEAVAEIAGAAAHTAHVAGTGAKVLAGAMKGLNVLGGTVAAVSLGINVYKGVEAYQKGDTKEVARESFKAALNATMLATAIAAPASGGTSLAITAGCIALSYAADTKAFDVTYDAIASVPEKIDAAKTAVKQTYAKAETAVKEGYHKAETTVKQTYAKAETAVKQTYAKAETAVKQTAAKAVTVAKETYKAVSTAAVGAYHTVKQGATQAVAAAKAEVKQVVSNVTHAVASAATTAKSYAASAYKSVSSYIPSFSW